MDENLKRRITDIQIAYGHELLDKQHVVGVAVGMKKINNTLTDQLCLVVMVDEKVPSSELSEKDRIPSEIDGVPVDVQETGFFSAQA